MKNFLFKLAFCLTFVSISLMSFAQVQKDEKAVKVDDQYFEMDYGYTRSGDKHVLQGAATIDYSETWNYAQYKTWYLANGYSKYTLKANHDSDKIHGPMSLVYKADVTTTKGDYSKIDCKFTGNFNKGVPNGAFSYSYEDSHGLSNNYGSFTYKNGKLVGAYKISKRFHDRYNAFGVPGKISGTFNQFGQMNGTWTFEREAYDDHLGKRVMFKTVYQFVNGFATAHPEYDTELSKLASQYSSGMITKQDLHKKGIVVSFRELTLYYEAKDGILEDRYIPWDELGSVTFPKEYELDGYKCLERKITFDAAGEKRLIELYKSFTEIETPPLTYLPYDEENEKYYYRAYKSNTDLLKHCVGTPNFAYDDGTFDYAKIYLSDETAKILNDDLKNRFSDEFLSFASSLFSSIANSYSHDRVMFDVNHRKNTDKWLNTDCLTDELIRKFESMGHLVNVEHLPVDESTPAGVKYIVACKYVESTYGEDRLKGYMWKQYYNENYQLIADLTFDENNMKVPCTTLYNEFEDLKVDIDSHKTALNKIFNSGTASDVKEKFESIINTYDQKCRYQNDITELCDIARTTLGQLQHCKAFLEKREKLLQEISKVENAAVAYPEIASAFNTYKNKLDMCWYPDKEDVINYDETISVIKTFTTAVAKAKEIDDNTKAICSMAASLPDVTRSYNTYSNSAKYSWNGNDYSSFDSIISVQENIKAYLPLRQEVEAANVEIVKALSLLIDDSKAYTNYWKGTDLSWKPGSDFKTVLEVKSIQSLTKAFADIKQQIIENNAKLKLLKKNNSKIYSYYNAFYSAQNLTWSPNSIDDKLKTLENVIRIQQGTEDVLNRTDLKMIAKELKENSIADIEMIVNTYVAK